MRVAIVGARRVRQGLGPFLARFCVASGAEIVAVLGTRPETAEAAAAEVEALGVPRPAACHDADAFHARRDVDALVIASPHASHAEHLERALAQGRHALCEKPLVWGGTDPEGRAARLAEGFAARGLHLRVNAQWPLTLPAFRALHPEAPILPDRFRMEMPPRLRGLPALLDSLSHPLSVLSTLLPGDSAEVRDLAFEGLARDATRCVVRFTYATRVHAIQAEVVLDSRDDPARTTRYALDGYEAVRTVEPRTYAMTLEGAGRRIPLPDPTPRLVRSFLASVASGAPARVDPAAVPGMRHLAQILRAAAAHLGVDLP